MELRAGRVLLGCSSRRDATRLGGADETSLRCFREWSGFCSRHGISIPPCPDEERMQQADLSACQIEVERILRNPSPATLYQEAMKRDPKTAISDRGALIAYSGDKTGRSPNDCGMAYMRRSALQNLSSLTDCGHVGWPPVLI